MPGHTSGNEFASILYFENDEALHRYAHGPMHSSAMLWWREAEKNLDHVGIMQEVFLAPEKSWEGVYLNYHPTGKYCKRSERFMVLTSVTAGLGSTTKEVTGLDGK